MTDIKYTDFPSVGVSTTSDIIWAVQAGADVQETLGQVIDLVRDNLIPSYAGNPNGSVAGDQYQLLWDTTNNFLWVCTTTGSAATAVWTQVVSGAGMIWNEVTVTTQTMSVNNGYIANNAGLVTLTLPATSAIGSVIYINGKGAGGWSIAQNASQLIHIGSSVSTTGVGGSVASTNRYDSMCLVCITANTEWAIQGAPQSSGLTIV